MIYKVLKVPGTGILSAWVSIYCKFCVSNMRREFERQQILRLIFASSHFFLFSRQRYTYLFANVSIKRCDD